MNSSTSAFRISRFNLVDDSLKEEEDSLAVEEPLEIKIIFGKNKTEKNISITMRTPGDDPSLAAGFLFTEGIIQAAGDILNIKEIPFQQSIVVELSPDASFNEKKLERHFYTSSSCGVCGKSSIDSLKTILPADSTLADQIQVSPELLTTLPEKLSKQQEVFNSTGGLHASALFDTAGNLLLLAEDVGRHNALDKLIGNCLKSGKLPLNNHILLLSGRASFELIQKAAMAGLRFVCAVGAPSSLAVQLAIETRMTLAGFLRNGRFNIYSGVHRIKTGK